MRESRTPICTCPPHQVVACYSLLLAPQVSWGSPAFLKPLDICRAIPPALLPWFASFGCPLPNSSSPALFQTALGLQGKTDSRAPQCHSTHSLSSSPVSPMPAKCCRLGGSRCCKRALPQISWAPLLPSKTLPRSCRHLLASGSPLLPPSPQGPH